MSLVILIPWTIRNYQIYGQFVIVEPRVMRILGVDVSKNPLNNNQSAHIAILDSIEKFTNNKHENSIKIPVDFLFNFAKEFMHFWELYPDRIVSKNKDFRLKVHAENNKMIVEQQFTSDLTKYISIFSFGPILLLAIIGIFSSRAYLSTSTLLFFVIISFAIGYSFFYGKTRYRIPIEPYMIIYAGYGVYYLFQIWQKKMKTTYK